MSQVKTATLTVTVCQGPSCSLLGGQELIDWARQLSEAGLSVACSQSGCTGNCLESPVVQWNERYVVECTPAKLTELLIEEGVM